MMPLTDIDRLKRTVTDAWVSPVADQVAAAWGRPPGTAKWLRSSACHVFVLPGDDQRYLRFIPDTCRGPAAVAAVAGLMARLHDRGAAVVRPVPSASGALTETVDTALGAMHAMVVEAARGERTEVSALTPTRARHWGRALARLHAHAAGLGTGLPDRFREIRLVPRLFAGDTALIEAAAGLAALMDGLPRDPGRLGVIHGDFELDNMTWRGDTPVAYDFDEAGVSWYGADIVSALRELTDDTGRPEPRHRERYDAFLAGYRDVRPLGEEDLAHLPLFTGLNAATFLVRVTRALDGAAETPQDLAGLRDALREVARTYRAAVIEIDRRMRRGARPLR
ncbi:phosphotransferase enzyme family protein [Streptomyces marincola]|uniref:phosphotransferase enzyme family protein n=1 Tax=Streptomyces marincola TaxID=2878388 RepID=UPI001CF4D27E|nr:phosphotransferase [Streptomyces marincola]UCM86579.1 phosphotransferase [Streptomyces marincola]